MCWLIFCVFHKFQGDSRFLHKIPSYFPGSGSQNKFQALEGFQVVMGTLSELYKPGHAENLELRIVHAIWPVSLNKNSTEWVKPPSNASRQT